MALITPCAILDCCEKTEISSRPEETDAATQVMTAVVSKSIAEGTGQGKAGSYEI